MAVIGFLFGMVSYAVFLASFLYAIGFVGNLAVPKSIDSVPAGPLGEALLVDAALLVAFALQHSLMARPAFKKWWTGMVPPSIERSVYVLISSMFLLLLFWKWEAIPGAVWSVDHPIVRMALDALFWLGWLIVVWSTCMIDHFDLFGLRQVYLRIRGVEYTPVRFKVRALYKYVRHPIMLGFLIAFWATPQMTVGHLLFSLVMTLYTFIGIHLEERDLATLHGSDFERYRSAVPMIVPVPGRWSR